jgi:endonuclease/exonuclease/phosphatase family metal-dependent hydrolase
MTRVIGLALVHVLVLGISAPASADVRTIKVMTQNQYLGADLAPLILAQTPEEFAAALTAVLTQIAANDFPLRSRRLATEIALTRPDLVALQEVVDIRLNGANPGPPFVDHLARTLADLAARSQRYVVAATVANVSLTIPIDVDADGDVDLVSVVDRDVILAREDVAFTRLAGHFTAGGLCGVPIPNPVPVAPFPVTLQSMPSADGCNYTVGAALNTPFGPLTSERGFVGVDATVRGRPYRVVNTHLEISRPDPGNPASGIFQTLQAVELVGTLQALTPPDMTLVVLGDFNSSPNDVPIGGIVPPYPLIAGSGYGDVWKTNRLAFLDPEGFTCCQAEDLSNTSSQMDERIDVIFVRGASFVPFAFVTGRVPLFPLRRPPNWASDHGGVFAELFFSRR